MAWTARPAFCSVRCTVLVHEGSAVFITAGCEFHVDVWILAMVLVIARTDDEQLRILSGAVLQAMSIPVAGRKTGTVPGAQPHFASIVYEDDFAT